MSASPDVRIDPNVEAVTCLLNLSEKGSRDWNSGVPHQPFRHVVMEHFAGMKTHPAVRLVDQLHGQRFWWDAMIELALHCTPFPSGTLKAQLPAPRYATAGSGNREKGEKQIDTLVSLINDFHQQSAFEAFWQEHQVDYDQVRNEVLSSMPGIDLLKTVEHYYGVTGYPDIKGYYLVPSPQIIGGNGFGIRVPTEKGLEIYNIFGSFRSIEENESGFGFDNSEAITNLSVHEFGHSFVNPLVEPPRYHQTIERFHQLYAPIRATGKMGYSGWVCVAEHIIRACEVRIAIALGKAMEAAEIQREYVENHSFVYLPLIADALVEYEEHRGEYPSLAAFVPELMETFESIAARAGIDGNAHFR